MKLRKLALAATMVAVAGSTLMAGNAFAQAKALQAKALKAASYFQKVMQATCDGQVFDAAAVRGEGLACRAWASTALMPAV